MPVEQELRARPQPYSFVGGHNAREEMGQCVICLDVLPSQPNAIVNLCSREPRCFCLIHKACLLDLQYPVDGFRQCLFCKFPTDSALIRKALEARRQPQAPRPAVEADELRSFFERADWDQAEVAITYADGTTSTSRAPRASRSGRASE